MKPDPRIDGCACSGCSREDGGLCLGWLVRQGREKKPREGTVLRFILACDNDGCDWRVGAKSKNQANEKAQAHANEASHVVEILRPHAPFLRPVLVAPHPFDGEVA